MMYMFIDEKQVERIKEKFKINMSDRPDVIVMKSLPETVWCCKECDREFPAYHPRRCTCGSWNGFKIVEK